jgi:hypothetical protein
MGVIVAPVVGPLSFTRQNEHDGESAASDRRILRRRARWAWSNSLNYSEEYEGAVAGLACRDPGVSLPIHGAPPHEGPVLRAKGVADPENHRLEGSGHLKRRESGGRRLRSPQRAPHRAWGKTGLPCLRSAIRRDPRTSRISPPRSPFLASDSEMAVLVEENGHMAVPLEENRDPALCRVAV